jgi:hypothetical protein
VIISLVPERRIVGRVVLPSGSDRLAVELYRKQVFQGRAYWNPQGDIWTRSNGEFRFADLESGIYKLFTKELGDQDPLTTEPGGPMYGYPPAYFPNAADFGSAGTIQVNPGTTFQAELTPVRRRYYPVKVPVANAPANDVFNQLEISAEPQGKKGPAFELGYNRHEQKIEGGLPDGIYVIKARSQGENLLTGEVTITVKGGPVEGPALTLLPAGSVQFNTKMNLQTDSPAAVSQEGTELELGRPGFARGQNLSVWLEPIDEFATADLLPHSVANPTTPLLSSEFPQAPTGCEWNHPGGLSRRQRWGMSIF